MVSDKAEWVRYKLGIGAFIVWIIFEEVTTYKMEKIFQPLRKMCKYSCKLVIIETLNLECVLSLIFAVICILLNFLTFIPLVIYFSIKWILIFYFGISTESPFEEEKMNILTILRFLCIPIYIIPLILAVIYTDILCGVHLCGVWVVKTQRENLILL